jgi:hypothetical protein
VSTLLFGALFVSGLGLPAAARGTLDLTDRTEVRVRDSGQPSDPALDLINEPGFRLGVETARSRYNFGYSARYTLMNAQIELKPALMNEAFMRAQWSASRRTKLTLTQDGSWGRQSFVAMVVTPTAPSAAPQVTGAPAGVATVPQINAVPQVESFQYIAWRPALTATTALSMRWTLDTTVFYAVNGGFDRASRLTLPRRWGPGAEARAEHLLSRRDKLFTTASATRTMYSSGPESFLVLASEGLRRRLTPTTDGEVAFGVAAAWARPDEGYGYGFVPYPTATALVSHRYLLERGAVVQIDVSSQLAPVVQRISGLVMQQLLGAAGVTFTEDRLVLKLETGGVQTLPSGDPQALRILYASANAGLGLGKSVLLEAGGRYALQEVSTQGYLPPQKVVFLAMTLREPTLKF